ncbi:hypothetical protein J6590_082591 [Homalodisca vitripennis]|nr:hypothetical protein J6590_082591 [Homalodisca vitripennis]
MGISIYLRSMIQEYWQFNNGVFSTMLLHANLLALECSENFTLSRQESLAQERLTLNKGGGLWLRKENDGVKKYVFLCSVCGGLASLLGTLFLAVYLILRTYTSSLDYFETIPTYIPAAMLMVTGLAVMCLARRRNRYIFLIKLCGLCCLMCVGTCVLVTVTTTVVHMSRLQSLRECVYTLKTQTCTCYSVLLESASERSDEGSRYVFNATPDCEAIHGPLYLCLRALFGLSVIGILVCIFCCMLVYQLLSHERKKMYWEQLELRCRYLYGQASNLGRNPGLAGAQPVSTQHCACCQQFRYQQDVLTWEPSDNRTRELLYAFKWEVFTNPPYSLDLAPSDCHLFLAMKTWLAMQHFDDDMELGEGVTD